MVTRNFCTGVFIVLCALWSDARAIVIPILREGTAYHEVIDACVPKPVRLSACIFEVVGFVERAELSYLAGLIPGSLITADNLKKAAAAFQAKRAFSTIKLCIDSSVDGAIRVRWQLERCWLVESVKVQSNVIGKQAYRVLYALEPGDPFEQEKHESSLQAIRDMLARDGFDHAHVTSRVVRNYARMGVAVKILVKRGSRVKPIQDAAQESQAVSSKVMVPKYTFEGNSFFSNDELISFLNAFGESADLVPDSIILDEIERAYHAKGFWQVHVSCKAKKNCSIITIKEGNRARIVHIDLITRHKKASFLIDQFFAGVLEQEFFDEQVVADAVDHLIAHYAQDGFFDIRVVQQEYHERVNGGYTLYIVLDEGEQGLLVDVVIPAFKDLEKEGIFSNLRSQMPLPCTTSCIQTQQQWLMAHFQSLGYERPTIKPDFKRSGNHMTIVWLIEPGKKVVFGKTIVIGNGTLPINYVLREKRINARYVPVAAKTICIK